MAIGLDPVVPQAAALPATNDSYADWPAIFAGAVLATAISVLMFAFGSALGLSFTNPFENTGLSAVGLAIALAAWLVWVQVSSFMAGGYVAGRLRRRINDATEHEVDVRDGLHGLLVWATGVVFGAVLLGIGATGIVAGTASAVGTAAGTAAAQITDAAEGTNPLAYAVDTAFRSDQPGETVVDARAEALGIVTRGIAAGDIPQDDRAYLATVVSRETGLPPEEAQARVDQMVTQAQTVATQAEDVAERARRFAIIAAFIAAASLAVSAAGAYWAAGIGGRHRDEGTIVAVWFDRLT